LLLSFFVATNFKKPKFISFGTSTEKYLSQMTTNYIVRYFLPKQLSLRAALKNMGRRSEIPDPEKIYHGSRGQKGMDTDLQQS
jgi:hypothetical protein